MLVKRIFHSLSAVVIAFAVLSAFAVPKAKAASITWTGNGMDSNFNNAANWSSDPALPGATDDVSFGNITLTQTIHVNSSIAVHSISFDCGSTGTGYDFVGSGTLTINGDIDSTCDLINFNGLLNLGGSATNLDGIVMFNGTVSGGADLIIAGGYLTANSLRPDFVGNIIINSGSYLITTQADLATRAQGAWTRVLSGGTLIIMSATCSTTIAEPIEIAGTGTTIGGNPYGALTLMGSGTAQTHCPLTLYSLALFNANANINLDQYIDATVTNYSPTTYALSLLEGSIGTVNLPGSYTDLDSSIITISDTQASTDVTIASGETYIINGVRRDIVINSGGTLKGTGTVGDVTLNTGGTIAPGTSPGVLHTGDLTFTGGTLQEEIAGTALGNYDQLDVTGSVALGAATTLTVTHFGGFTPALNNSFTIIDNDGADPVTGTFVGMAENSTFTVAGYTYRINYNAGDGNDVVLTVTAVPALPTPTATPTPTPTPAAPNTGFTLLKASPLMSIAGGLLVAAGLALIAKRTVVNKK
jgi:fibronectin-binding autotransporter adhesin